MANTQRAPNTVALAATFGAIAAGVALIAIIVGATTLFWIAGVIFVLSGLGSIALAARENRSARQGTVVRSGEMQSRPNVGNVPPPKPPEGRRPSAP